MKRRKKMQCALLPPAMAAPIQAGATAVPFASARPKPSQWQVIRPAALGFLLGLTVAAAVYSRRQVSAIEPASFSASFAPPPLTSAEAAPPAFVQPETFNDLLAVPPDQLGQVDVALMNLLCNEGLPGSETINTVDCLRTLHQWAQQVQVETNRYFYQYQRNPAKFQNDANRFKMMILMTTLGDDFGVHYDERHPNDESDREFFATCETTSIHTALGPRRAGTCASLPVLVVAIGRRLGYPLKLVSNGLHGYARWDDGTDRFNIECTNLKGLAINTDDHYRNWPRPLTDEMIAEEGYLQPESPRQELAQCLFDRATVLDTNGRSIQAHEVCYLCSCLVPTSVLYKKYSQLPDDP
jgi:hypothetical protein